MCLPVDVYDQKLYISKKFICQHVHIYMHNEKLVAMRALQEPKMTNKAQ